MKILKSFVSLVAVLLIMAMGPAPGGTTDEGWTGMADHPGYVTNTDVLHDQVGAMIGVENYPMSQPNAGSTEMTGDSLGSEVRPYEVSTRLVPFIDYTIDDAAHAAHTTERWCGYTDLNGLPTLRV